MSQPVDATLPIGPQQIGELFDRHAAALVLYARQWTTSADDCVQESLIELASQSVAPTNPAAWLYRVVRNRALNASRAARRRSSREQAAIGARRATTEPDSAAQLELSEALRMLESDAREIVVLRVWGQLSWQEIADVIGGSKSAAQRHYVEALQQLRKLWDAEPCPTK
jgi:RNA polymerase sigma factor (sigma-70 family)